MAHREACRGTTTTGVGVGQGHRADIGNILCRHREGEGALLHKTDEIKLVSILRHDGDGTITQKVGCGNRRNGIPEHCAECRQT